ncbi:unnamed protein product [Rotaria magnacalcarata]|uniref:Uncharacterized protein n=1 Tax=Rotaria magnacalcarata TaxID=392030 RepID=A0A8S2QGF5_9BILA|nr:unnamed protein product [Rotaria magnacalcarata]CAF4103887.1 unnamed protein product [Rotaria magnacalcarata]CAF5015553.1 unnamed protein product [Rotaria magnacalcarata]
MFYENAEFQLASFHVKNQNNNASIGNKSHTEENRYLHKQFIINIVLIGDKNIGKSRLIKNFLENIFHRRKSFKNHHNSFNIIYQRNEQSNEEKLHLKFHSINLTYQTENNFMSICSLADCLLFVYDINNQISFNHLIDRCLPLIQSEHIFSYSLIGIKHRGSLRQVSHSQVDELIKKFKLFYYEIKSSSSYEDLLKEILDNYFDKKFKTTNGFNMIKSFNKLCNIYRSYL